MQQSYEASDGQNSMQNISENSAMWKNFVKSEFRRQAAAHYSKGFEQESFLKNS